MKEVLTQIVGEENISQNELDLLCYSRDLAPLPDELLKSYGVLKPEVVVRPKTTEEVGQILKYASAEKIPVTPRGGGSWALGGTIPVEGGIVLDLTQLDQILELNEKDEYVRVQAGVVWKRLSDYLARKGFELGTYPSSAPSATVGGFIATGGAGGIGVAKFGPVAQQIISMKVVLPSGEVIETNPWESWLFAGAEGTLGIITEVVLKVFPSEEKRHFLFSFNTIEEGIEAFEKIYQLKPYYLTLIDQGFIQCLNEKGPSLPERELMVVFTLRGSKDWLNQIEKQISEICQRGERESEELAREEWENKFRLALSIKSLGPTIFSPEIQVPVTSLNGAFRELKQLLKKRKHAIEAMANHQGMVTILPIILTDERNRADFFKVFSFTKGITGIGYRASGCVYGIGLYNTPHLKKIHRQGASVMRQLKEELDPYQILNPSKTIAVRIPGIFQSLFMTVMKFVPQLVASGLKTVKCIPTGMIRFGLKMIGGQLR